MNTSALYVVLLAVSLTFLFAQLSVRHKHVSHLLFAAFCGSVALMTVKKLSGDHIGVYQYLIGMGACATCNGYWLLARSLFRKENPIAFHHIVVAVFIAFLIMIQQGYLFVDNVWQFESSAFALSRTVIGELTVLLSSCILILSFWEGARGFKDADRQEKMIRAMFLVSFASVVGICKTVQGTYPADSELQQWAVTGASIFIICMTQTMLILKYGWRGTREQQTRQQHHDFKAELPDEVHNIQPQEASNESDFLLAQSMKDLLITQQRFLQTNLKVADVARELNVPEYRIGNAVRHHIKARNFNQYVNQLRVAHAQELLRDPDKQHWSVLVVGLESGFASVGPFSRAFKAFAGVTPNQYRQQVGAETAYHAEVT